MEVTLVEVKNVDKKWLDYLKDDLEFVYANNIKPLINQSLSQWEKDFPYAWSFDDGEYFHWSTGQIEHAECWFESDDGEAKLTSVRIYSLYITLSKESQKELAGDSEYEAINLDGTVIVEEAYWPEEVREIISEWETKINKDILNK